MTPLPTHHQQMTELPTGATLHVQTWGDVSAQTPVVLLHGMLGTPQLHFAGLITYLNSNGYTIVAPTLRGYGESLPKPRDFPLRFYERDADDVLALLDALAIERAHVVGYSDGGEIALICAGRAPQRFATVAVWGAVGFFGPQMRPVAQRMLDDITWLNDEDRRVHQISDSRGFVEGWVRATVDMIDAGGDVSLSLARHIEAPLLMMLGVDDTLNPRAYAEQFVAQTGRGRLVMFPGGHPVQENHPAELAQALTMHFHEGETGAGAET